MAMQRLLTSAGRKGVVGCRHRALRCSCNHACGHSGASGEVMARAMPRIGGPCPPAGHDMAVASRRAVAVAATPACMRLRLYHHPRLMEHCFRARRRREAIIRGCHAAGDGGGCSLVHQEVVASTDKACMGC
jgi:hypothetical protein